MITLTDTANADSKIEAVTKKLAEFEAKIMQKIIAKAIKFEITAQEKSVEQVLQVK